MKKESLMTLVRVETKTGSNQTVSGQWMPAIAFRFWVRRAPTAKEQALPWVTMTTPEAKQMADWLRVAIAQADASSPPTTGTH